MATWSTTALTAQATTLNGALATTGGTSLTVTSAAGFPGSANYNIIIDDEELTVTAGQGTTTWTVTRGVNGSNAATHLTAAAVRQTVPLGATDRVWFNGSGGGSAGFGINVVVNSYQDTTHVTNNSDVHQCNTNHPNNVKFLTSTTQSLNGAGSAALSALVITNAQLRFNFWDPSSVATQSGFFYVYAGSDGTSTAGIATIQAAQAATTSTWVSAGTGITTGSLGLADQTAAITHDFYIAVSVTPLSTGAKTTMTAKITLTYV